MRDLTGHVASHDDSHGVVSGSAVAERDHSGNAHLSGLVALHDLAQLLDDPLDTAVLGDQLRHTAAQQGQEEDLVHAAEAVVNSLSETGQIDSAGGDAHDTGSEDADGQHQEHVHADQSQDQNQQIGNNLDEAVGQVADLGNGLGTAHDQQHHDGDQSGRQSGEEVHAELITHLAVLAAGSGDGGIGDHGQVIAEHSAADNCAQNDHHIQAALFRNADSDGSDGGDGAHGSTGSGAHESADDEQASGQELDGNQAQAQVDGSVTAAHLSSHGSERAGQDVDDQHGQNVHVGSALGERIKLFVDAALEHDEGHQNGQEHRGNRGELIECHVDALGLVNQTGAHVDNDEYQEREQCETIRFFVVQGIAHIGFLLFSSKAC